MREHWEAPVAARLLWGAAAATLVPLWAYVGTGGDEQGVQFGILAVVFALSAAACVARALNSRQGRAGWLTLAGGIAGFGMVTISYVIRPEAVGDFPSVADIGTFSYVLTAAAFVLFARRELTGLPRALWLDAAIGAFALAAVGMAVLLGVIPGGTNVTPATQGVLYYVTADLMLAGFVFVAWGLAGFGRRTLLLLGVGAAPLSVLDGTYAFFVADGRIAWPVEMAAGWASAATIIASAAAVHTRSGKRRDVPRASLVLIPVLAAVAAIAVLVYDHQDVALAWIPATAALILSLARLALSLIDNQRAEERRRREEEERRAREEAERANREKTAFLSRMSHEVRTPLNSILGFAQLLVDDVDGADRESVERILRAGNHLRQLIDDILDLSSIEAGETAIRLDAVDLDAAVEESIALMDPMARRSNVRIARRDGSDPPSTVLADAQRLSQSLLNLLSNAVKYGGPDAEVVVSVERVGGCARVSVSDTGPGIPAEDVPKVFLPFERGRARGSAVEGTGIGLALTKNLVEAMGGAIDVDTGPGGSTFRIDLPVTEAVVGGGPDASVGGGAAGGDGTFTVLYIEDQESNIELVERLLARRDDYRLVAATTAREGLRRAAALLPDLVLLDLDLPDLRGEEVLLELRADPSTAAIPTVVVSADATAWRQQELARAGAAAYIVKPLQLSSFLTTLDGVLRRRTAATS